MTYIARRAAAAVLLPAWLMVVPSLSAQEFPTFGGAELRGGLVLPTQANSSWGLGVDADLGEPFLRFRVLVGYHGFQADVDRVVGGTPLVGDIRAHGLRAGSRFQIRPVGLFSPYVTGFLTIYNVSPTADLAADQGLMDDVYEGTMLGTSLSLGATYPLEGTGQLLALGEVRRVFIGTLRHWAVDLGLRLELR